MWKKRIGLVALMLVVFVAFSALAEMDPFLTADFAEAAVGDMAEADALALARQEWKDKIGVTDEDFTYGGYLATLLQMADGKRVWAVAMRNREMDNPLYIVALDAQTGELYVSRPYDHASSMMEWESTLGTRPLWSLKEKALFDRLYLRFSEDTDGFLMPVEGMISQEEATQIAYDALVAEGLPASRLDSLISTVELQRAHFGGDVNTIQDTWSITFRYPVPDANGEHKEVGAARMDAYDGSVVNVIVMSADSKG